MKILFFLLLFSLNITGKELYYYNSYGQKRKIEQIYKNYIVYNAKDDKAVKKILDELNIKIIKKRKYKNIRIIKISANLNKELESLFKEKKIKTYLYFGKFDTWPVIVGNRGVILLKKGYDIVKISKKFNFEVISKDKDFNTYIIQSKNILETVNILKEKDITEISQPDFILPHKKMYIPNDMYFNWQWHLSSMGDIQGIKKSANISAPDAWDMEKGNPNIKIAIIDDGMDTEHIDLKNKVIAKYNFLDKNDFVGNNEGEEAYHGTACAGVAAAQGDNGIGMTGSCPECSLISARILGKDDDGNYAHGSIDADAIKWAAGGNVNGPVQIESADIISCSWGFQQPVDLPFTLKTAIDYAVTKGRNGKGCVVLFASGNEGRRYENSELPAYQNIITVGASTDADVRARYSNYGFKLDFLAPSNGGKHGICTTDYHGIAGYNNGNLPPDSSGDYTCTFGGTSSATPLVSGIAGLILSKNPNLTWKEVRNILRASCDKINTDYVNYIHGKNEQYGYGRVNAYKALKLSDESLNDLGENCQNDDDCYFSCINGNFWKDGFCSLKCETGYCPKGSICIDHIKGIREPYCLKTCETSKDCKEGYACSVYDEYDTQTYCIPGCSLTGCPKKLQICNNETELCENDITNPCWNNVTSSPKICRELYKECNEETGNCECMNGYYELKSGECIENVCETENITCSENAYCEPEIGECICKKGYIQNGKLCIKKPENKSSCSYGKIDKETPLVLIFFILFLFYISKLRMKKWDK